MGIIHVDPDLFLLIIREFMQLVSLKTKRKQLISWVKIFKPCSKVSRPIFWKLRLKEYQVRILDPRQTTDPGHLVSIRATLISSTKLFKIRRTL